MEGWVGSLFNLTTDDKMAPPSKRTVEDLARVAEMMDNYLRDDNKALREENEYRVQETDYYFGKMVDAFRRVEDMENRWRMAEGTIARLRQEREFYAQRAHEYELILARNLETREQLEAILANDEEYDSDITIMDELMGL